MHIMDGSSAVVLKWKVLQNYVVCTACIQNKANIGKISFPRTVLQSNRALCIIHKRHIHQHIQDYVLNYYYIMYISCNHFHVSLPLHSKVLRSPMSPVTTHQDMLQIIVCTRKENRMN